MNAELRENILTAYREDGQENSYDFPWQQTAYSPDGRTLYVYERPERPGSVRVRWQATDEEQAARDEVARPSPSVSLPEPLRDKRGRLRKKATDRAVDAAKAVYEEWLSPSSGDDEPDRPATLEDVFRYFLDPKDGKGMSERWKTETVGTFPVDPSRRTHLAIIADVLGLDTPAADIGMPSARRLWRSVADHHGKSGVGGWSARQLVSTLISALNYARRDELVPMTDGIIHGKWQDNLKKDWLTRTGVSMSDEDVDRESHTEEETAKIIEALPLADARIRVAFPIGAGLRLGQMSANLTRRGIKEGGVFGTYAEFMDRKAKQTVRIDLPPVAQRELRHAMEDGHLRKLEAAYQAGDIDDYYIVPGGHMKDGACQVRYCHEPLSRESVLKFFHELEAAAGVEHVKGRAWHGLRRAFEALVARHTNDPNVKDKAGGWRIGGGTRMRIYMNKEGKELTDAVAHARAAALADVSSAASPAERTEDLSVQARLHLDLLAEAAEETGDTGLTEDVASATELIARIQKRAQELVSEAAKHAGPRLTREELEAKRREETAAAIREEIERQGLTGKAAAEIAGVSPSYVSAALNEKAAGNVATETLEGMLEALRASPETAD